MVHLVPLFFLSRYKMPALFAARHQFPATKTRNSFIFVKFVFFLFSSVVLKLYHFHQIKKQEKFVKYALLLLKLGAICQRLPFFTVHIIKSFI
jgi:hypothetical protein